ncbi:MAG: sigma 54-interacting transcriptional regulator [Myxococcota bacterium]
MPTIPPVPGYGACQELSRDDWYLTLRARRNSDGQSVLLRGVLAGVAPPLASAGLKREYELLSELAGEGVPRVIAFESPWLVLADEGLSPLSMRAQELPLALRHFFELARQLLRCLARVHEAGVVHRRIAASSVLIADERAQLFDFSGASRLAELVVSATRAPASAREILSPEQTGRIQRVVDFRSDFYALGMVFYQLLTGRAAFEASDALELAHFHIARAPVPVAAVLPRVPENVSRVVQKLLAKLAEDRYQSIAGILHDLDECERRIEASDSSVFELADGEPSPRLTFPQRLFGRDAEEAVLAEALAAAQTGTPSFVFVSGGAGVGKTALLESLRTRVHQRDGYFLAGKFDVIERSQPYSALRQALSDFVQELAHERAQQRSELLSELRSSLGQNARVLTELVPALQPLLGEVALGEVSPLPTLGPLETQNRLALSLGRLLSLLARPHAPLVIALDDLQWADLVTLRLISSVFFASEKLPILWLGAFRDTEVLAEHPVARLRSELKQSGAAVHEIVVAPLAVEALARFLGETLHCPAEELSRLTRVVANKTLGNAFFVRQFLQSLERDRLLTFDASRRAWRFDLERIEALAMTDNVLELMTRKLGYLAGDARRAIRAAACIGSPFRLGTLARVLREPASQVAAALWDALLEGLVLPLDPNYELLLASDSPETIEFRFLHDRVQQAAYALIAQAERAAFHLQVGRNLSQSAELGAQLFEVVGHLNRARELIVDVRERRQLAEWNLEAGRKARTAAAIPTALGWFRVGLELCAGAEPDELAFQLALAAAECEYIAGEAALAEQLLDSLFAQHAPLPLCIEALCVRCVRYENTGRFAESIEVGAQALALLEMPLLVAAEARSRELAAELVRIEALRAGRDVATWVELPSMCDPKAELAARVMVAIWPSAFLTNQAGLTDLLSARLVRLSLERGNARESALGYVTYAITNNAREHRYDANRAFAELGLALAQRLQHTPLIVKVEHLYGSFLSVLYEPLANGSAHAELAHSAALESGDLTYAARAAFMGSWYEFFGGTPLDVFEERALGVVDFLKRVRHEMIERAEWLLVQWARALRGATRDPASLSDQSFDESSAEQALSKVPIFIGFLNVARAFLRYTFGDVGGACESVAQAGAALSGSAETIWHHQLAFCSGLVHAASLRLEKPAVERAVSQNALQRARVAVERLAVSNPKTFGYQRELLRAEQALGAADFPQAERSFERAVELSQAEENLAARALCHELFGNHLARCGDRARARRELSASLLAYDALRAHAKLRQLRETHADLLEEPAPRADFDASSALKAARAIAAEIQRDRLLPRLIRILIENAGAERGVLLEAHGDELVIVAEGNVGDRGWGFLPARPPQPGELPLELVKDVLRSGQPLLADDARHDARLREDPYVHTRAARSLLCVPILSHGDARAVVFLENALVSHVFAERLQMVQVLAAQAAISLENARLYQSMREEVQRRAEVEAALTQALAELDASKKRLQAENVYLQEELQSHHNFEEIVGRAPELLAALRLVERVAQTDSTVLITGETGTGKELFARAIHSRSQRSERALVKVNCGAIASGLVESELFGHMKGAFTGALHRRIGRFELAHGGTIFLDEVGELPLETQTKLLRVLQEHEFEPVGSSATQRVDVRVIAATNRDLDEAVRAGRFRADLLYRLNVFPIAVPPLRRRSGDVPLLVSFFLTRMASRLGKRLEGFSRADMQSLAEYTWPGNVRELENVVERAAILASGAQLVLEPQSLPTLVPGSARSATPHEAPDVLPRAPAVASTPASGVRSLDEVERRHILSVLESSGWVVEGERGAAKVLGMHPNTLRSRMKKLGISRQEAASSTQKSR